MRPRIRTLKPEVWQDEKIGGLSHGARLLFVGLITMADDEGRLRELSALILGHVFPYDDVSPAKLRRWLSEIADAGVVLRYEKCGCRYIAFCRWSKHQKVDKARSSELPAPPDFDDHSSNDHRIDRGTVDDDSLSLRTRVPRDRGSDPDPYPGPKENGDSEAVRDSDRALFEYWCERTGHKDAKPTRDRMAKLRSRRNEGYSAEQIRLGIDGAARAPFVNDAGKRFDDIELICRNGSKLESFIERAVGPVAARDGLSELDRKRLASMNRLAVERGVA